MTRRTCWTRWTAAAVLAIGLLAAARPAAGAYYALLIGISDYPGYVNDLQYCDEDAVDMGSALSRRANWSGANITTLLDGQATRGQIEASINAISARMDSGDVFLFFYAGHGVTVPDAYPYDESDGWDECLYAYDGEIVDDTLSSWLSGMATDRIIVILDSCFSGGMIRGQGGVRTPAGMRRNVVRRGDGFARDLSWLSGAVTLTACADDESSTEFKLIRNGFFTFLTTTLMNRFADPNRDGLLSMEELDQGLQRWDRAYDLLRQHPQFFDNYPAGNPASAEQVLLVR